MSSNTVLYFYWTNYLKSKLKWFAVYSTVQGSHCNLYSFILHAKCQFSLKILVFFTTLLAYSLNLISRNCLTCNKRHEKPRGG